MKNYLNQLNNQDLPFDIPSQIFDYIKFYFMYQSKISYFFLPISTSILILLSIIIQLNFKSIQYFINTTKPSSQMRLNIIDVTLFLTLISPTPDSLQYYRQLCKSRNTISQPSISSELMMRTSNSVSKFPSKNKTQKKQQKLIYEIVDNKKITLYCSVSAANSYIFDYIQQTKGQINYLIDWALNITNKNIGYRQEVELKINCNLILTYNYQKVDFYTLILGIGKKLISQGFIFQINTHFYQSTSYSQQFYPRKDNRQRRSSINREQAILTGSSQITKNIKFISQLKDYLISLRQINEHIQKIWIFSTFFQLGVGIYEPENNSFGIDVLSKLVKDYEQFISQKGMSTGQSINYKVALSTISEVPNQNNIQRCKLNFQQTLILSKNIKEFGIQRKQLFEFSHRQDFTLRQKQNANDSKAQVLKESLKQNRKKSSKAKKTSKQNNKYTTLQNVGSRTTLKIKQNKQRISSSSKNISDQSSQFSPDFIIKNKSRLKHAGTQTNLAGLMAQNMHLKWQLQTIQKQYQIQSQKFILKNEKKYKDIVEQRSYFLQQNSRLRKDNEQLLRQITALKHDYQAAFKSRQGYQKILEEKNKQNQMAIQKRYKDKVKDLEQEIKNLKSENKFLQRSLNDAKASLQDGRRRNRQKLQQMAEQIKTYQKFSEQVKVSYDQLQQQARLDKNRCENLQKRCKKYQQTLSDLIKLKSHSGNDSSSSRNQDVQNNQIVCKAYQIINQPDLQHQRINQTEKKEGYTNLNSDRRSKKSSKGKQKERISGQQVNGFLKSKLNTKRGQEQKKQNQFNLMRVQDESEAKRKKKARYITFTDQPHSNSDR